MPRGVPSIVAMEAMERFAYYGFRAVLTLYLRDWLGLSSSLAISAFEWTSSLAYASPLLGGWLADGVLGKYSTILWLGAVYCAGLWVLVVAAWRRSLGLSVVALVLAGVGTGGIKPCVSSFGADQFPSTTKGDDDPARRRYFALFYAAINVGSVASFIVTPLARAQLGYAAAFALPATLLSVSLLSFYAARNLYSSRKHRREKHSAAAHSSGAASSSEALQFSRTLGRALKETFCAATARRLRRRRDNEDECFSRVAVVVAVAERAADDEERDVVALRRAFRLLCALPIFWTLYDQQGSVWVVQAYDMARRGWIQPEQVGVFNPIFILLLLPFFDTIVYPSLERHLGKAATSPTSRIKAGMVFAAVAFFVAAGVDASLPLNILWQLPQIFLISVAEILVCVTGLEYSYAQAPPAYRALVTSAYLLTTAVGDALAGILYAALGPFVSRTSLLLGCAAAMLAVVALFTRITTDSSTDVLLNTARAVGDDDAAPDCELQQGSSTRLLLDNNNITNNNTR